jgi:hypothetical protein
MAGASVEATLELWACSLRDLKERIRPLFTRQRVADCAGAFLDGLLSNERCKTGWNRHVSLVMLAFAMLRPIRRQANQAQANPKPRQKIQAIRRLSVGPSRRSAA